MSFSNLPEQTLKKAMRSRLIQAIALLKVRLVSNKIPNLFREVRNLSLS
ncbi:hypothetical protein [Nostoc sp. CALU 1950]